MSPNIEAYTSGPKPAPNGSQPRTNSTCSHMSCSQINRSPSLSCRHGTLSHSHRRPLARWGPKLDQSRPGRLVAGPNGQPFELPLQAIPRLAGCSVYHLGFCQLSCDRPVTGPVTNLPRLELPMGPVNSGSAPWMSLNHSDLYGLVTSMTPKRANSPSTVGPVRNVRSMFP